MKRLYPRPHRDFLPRAQYWVVLIIGQNPSRRPVREPQSALWRTGFKRHLRLRRPKFSLTKYAIRSEIKKVNATQASCRSFHAPSQASALAKSKAQHKTRTAPHSASLRHTPIIAWICCSSQPRNAGPLARNRFAKRQGYISFPVLERGEVGSEKDLPALRPPANDSVPPSPMLRTRHASVTRQTE